MKKRNIILVSIITLMGLLAVGTMAWFTAESDPVVNRFKAGTVAIELHDDFDKETAQNVNPGDSYKKVVNVENKGTEKSFIRVKLEPKWADGLPNEVDGVKIADYPILNGWVLHTDGWYYYPQIVEAGKSTPNIIEEVNFKGKEMTNDYQGKEFELTVEAQAIQASNGAALDEWGVDPLKLSAK